jgi:hypothetical protein
MQNDLAHHHNDTVDLFSVLSGVPPLLPGERYEEYEALRDAIIADIQPQNTIEWLWINDLLELSWEIFRYRRLRQKLLETSRELAIQACLEKIDLSGIDEDDQLPARRHIKENAMAWRSNPQIAAEIESRLSTHKIDNDVVSIEVIVQSRQLYLLFDTLLSTAQTRRIVLLREIQARRTAKGRASPLSTL